MISYWIQRADFSTQDFTAESELEVLKVLSAHDWEGELGFRRQLESEGKECCDPGIGILPGDGRILHICPVDIDPVYLHYHYTEKTKRLGIFPSHRDFVRSNMQVALA